ncbi:MAG: DUF4260 family protein [Rhodopseudomonas sp.]|nr:DUF4260 family protein [Rhodopseudomonas sp.]
MSEPAGVSGLPRILLRAEGVAVFALSLLLYAKLGPSWWLLVVLFLSPDLSFLGYLAGPRIGALVYNAAHTLVGPLALAIAGLLLPAFILVVLALIWTAHIGFDRMLGYGLKYGTGFGFTHLGRIGKASTDRT